MKLFYILILVTLISCSKTRLLVDQDNYNDYTVHTNSKLVIPKTFELVKPVTTISKNSSDKETKLTPTEQSIIKQTNNFDKGKSENFPKRENKLQRIF